jgi:hypothetical protein
MASVLHRDTEGREFDPHTGHFFWRARVTVLLVAATIRNLKFP